MDTGGCGGDREGCAYEDHGGCCRGRKGLSAGVDNRTSRGYPCQDSGIGINRGYVSGFTFPRYSGLDLLAAAIIIGSEHSQWTAEQDLQRTPCNWHQKPVLGARQKQA